MSFDSNQDFIIYKQTCQKSMNEMLLYALANADDDRYGHEGGYAIIHGAQPVPDLPGASKSFDSSAKLQMSVAPFGIFWAFFTS